MREVSFCEAKTDMFSSLLKELEDNLRKNRMIECNGCSVYHLFYHNIKDTRYSSVPVSDAAFESGFHKRLAKLCDKNVNHELIHLIYGKDTKYIDYHIFSNNLVVYEEFGLKDGELLDAKVYEITSVEFEDLKKLFSNDFYNSDTLNNCPENGLLYGYIETIQDGKHGEYFTCGDSTPAGKIFNKLKERLK